ncbi:hypothetical protein PMAYCL1PPCAC_27036, partial [Pristionchus mayeri]
YISVCPGNEFTSIGDQFVRIRFRSYPNFLPYFLPISTLVCWLFGGTVEQAIMSLFPLLVDPSLRPPSGSFIDCSFKVTNGYRMKKMYNIELEVLRL